MLSISITSVVYIFITKVIQFDSKIIALVDSALTRIQTLPRPQRSDICMKTEDTIVDKFRFEMVWTLVK